MRVGVVLDGRRSAPEIAGLAQLAERHGLAHVWLGGGSRTKDHFVRLAAAATATRRVELGPVAVSPFELHPAQLALALLTLDEAAGGRATAALGSGGDLAAALGAPRTGRVERLSECLDIVRLVAAGGRVSYAGRHFRVDGLVSPWKGVTLDRLLVAANRPRMLALAAEKGDGVMLSDMPPAAVEPLVARVQAARAAAGRAEVPFRVSNWFVWNVQESRAEAERLARRQLGFRLYYIRDVAAAIGLDAAEAETLARRQPEMVRAVLEGGTPWMPPDGVAERLIEHLTLTADRRGLDACVERLRDFARRGLTDIVLAPHGDPAAAIALLGDAVVPHV